MENNTFNNGSRRRESCLVVYKQSKMHLCDLWHSTIKKIIHALVDCVPAVISRIGSQKKTFTESFVRQLIN